MAKYVAYVGTYTHANSVGIHVYDVDVENGILTERSVTPINNPSYLTISDNGKYLYSIADEGVAAFSIDKNGDLTKMNQEWIGGMRGCHVEVDSQNRYLFVAGYHDGRVTMMKLNPDGSIGPIADGIFHQGGFISASEKRLDHPKVTCVTMTPDQKYLCAVDFGLNHTKVYEVDYEHGKLKLEDIIRSNLDAGARIIRFSSDGRFAYIMTGEENTMEVYSYELLKDGTDPEFNLIQTVDLSDEKLRNAAATCFRFSSDESHVFATIDAINGYSVLKRNAKDGTLTYEGTTMVSGDYPKALDVLPGDKYIVVLNHDTNEIRTFEHNYEGGFGLMKNAPITIDKPNCIRIHRLD
ncbi:MAG: lactonase family protein [Lachnospiraceae bacterium]|nr:lactonase family protein [Lachnospiraceae bacterium]